MSHLVSQLNLGTVKSIIPIDHFTVACLVTGPWNESEAGVDIVLIVTSLLLLGKILLISMITASLSLTKAEMFLSKQAQLQPHYYSKTRQLSTQLENSLLMRKNKNVQVERKTGGSRVQRRRRSNFNPHQTGGELSRLCQPCSPH